jgi:outer membrane protein assembly factor BamB
MFRSTCMACWLTLVASIASGQAFFPMDQGNTAGRFIDPPRSIMQQLNLAEQAIEQGRYGEAVASLGEMLQRENLAVDDELAGQDFFIVSGNASPTDAVAKTLVGEARRMLSDLPAEAIAQYELIYGAQARKLLDDAAASRNWSDVHEVKRRFFHTAAGRDASQLLLHQAIFHGDLLQARRIADLVVTHPLLDKNSREQTAALISTLDKLTTDKATAKSNASVDAPDAIAGYAKQKSRREEMLVDVRKFSDLQVSAENGGGQLPLPDPLYTVVTIGSEKQERALRESVESMSVMGELAPPSWLPLRVGNQLLMRTTERLVGVDFVTGKRVWEYPWFETTQKVESSQTDFDGMPDDETGYALLKQRVWNDIPYGRISSDGERVFLLGDLAQVEMAMISPLMGFQGTRPAETGTNSLIALDLATEGKLVWQLGGDLPGGEAFAGAFFLGAPLPIDDAIYVMAEMAGDIVLLCLDAATGSERWRQQLLAIETGGIDNDAVRRVAGASASYKDGLLICSTGAGAVVAVDIHDRSLVWGTTIERNDVLNQNALGRREGFIPDHLLKRWWDPTPMIEGRSVYLTPIEADRLFAFDLLTGKKRWKEISRNQTDSRYLAGVHDGSIVLVGGSNVKGINKLTGQSVWKTPKDWLDSGEQISGLGMFGMIEHPVTKQSVAAYFVPTSSNRIIAVSLQDGSALAHRKTTYPTGNLVAVDGMVISQAATLLSVAHGQVSLAPKVAAALEADPNNVEMINRKAQLLMEQGQRIEALEWLGKSRQLDPENIEVQQLTIDAMFGALREDFIGNVKLLAELDRLIDQPADRAELLKLQVRAAIDNRQPVEAVNRLIDLSLLVFDPSLSNQSNLGDSESTRSVSLDSWISARVTEAQEDADESQREQIAASLTNHLNHYRSASTTQMQSLVRQFGALPGSEPLTRHLLSSYLVNKEWLAMERVVLASASATPEQLDRFAPWQAIALASAYANGGLKLDAAVMFKLAMENEDEATRAAKELGIDLDELAALSVGGDFLRTWEGQVSVQLPQDPIAGRISPSRRISVAENRRVVGESFRGWQLVSEESSPVALRDPLGNLHPIPVDGRNRAEETHRQAVFNGGLMIAVLPGELIAVNLFNVRDIQDDPVLWRKPWQTDGGGSGYRPRSHSTKFGDQIYRYQVSSGGSNPVSSELQLGPIVGNTFFLLQGNELIAMDAMTRKIQWRNQEAPNGGAIVCDGQTVAIVSPNSQMIVKYDCRDGKRIGEVPFVDYQLWASTDQSVLVYRDLPEGKRELVLMNPISGEVLLKHLYEGLDQDVKVLGRIVQGTYVVTLANDGQVLIWDLEKAKVISEVNIDAIPNLSGLHVLPRNDSLVILPAVDTPPEDSNSVPVSPTHGVEHVKVDVGVWAIDLNEGDVKWNVLLGKEVWGCTLTQSPVSPIVALSRSKPRYLTTGNRVRSIDVMAIDVRDGKTYPSLDLAIESFNNDIETRQVVQPPQQRVIVNIGPMVIDYTFGDNKESIRP